MRTTEDMHLLETELELLKQDFRQDVQRVANKIHEARDRLKPRNFFVHRPLLVLGLGLMCGFITAY
jgi:hypothetical protein